MTQPAKRKDPPNEATGGSGKRKKGGSGGKWKTSHQQATEAARQNGQVSPGDVGIWVSCAKNMETKAARELTSLFEEYAGIMYGATEDTTEAAAEDDEDIETAVQKELDSMRRSGDGDSKPMFTAVQMNVACVLFVRTRQPVDPVDLARRVCLDAKSSSRAGKMRTRYVNRLTPMTAIGKATEQGLLEVAKTVLSPWFDLSGKTGATAKSKQTAEMSMPTEDGTQGEEEGAKFDKLAASPTSAPVQVSPAVPKEASHSFAIRVNIRNNHLLKRDVVIEQIAGLINDERHKVNLKTPDKFILVDVYQTVCGMSVVDGDWDELRKYNLTELYTQANKPGIEEA